MVCIRLERMQTFCIPYPIPTLGKRARDFIRVSRLIGRWYHYFFNMLCGGVDQIGMGVGQTRGLSLHADVLPELVTAYNPLFIRGSRRVLKPAPRIIRVKSLYYEYKGKTK